MHPRGYDARSDDAVLTQRLSALASRSSHQKRTDAVTRINRALTWTSAALTLLVGALWLGGYPVSSELPSIYRNWLRAVAREDGDTATFLSQHRDRVRRLPDPFVTLLGGRAASRPIVLWEDDRAVVIYDTFAAGPRALVVARGEGIFPNDVDPAMMEHLQLVARATGAALIAAARVDGTAQAWINAPPVLMAPRLYVNVQPGLFRGDVDYSERFIRRTADGLATVMRRAATF